MAKYLCLRSIFSQPWALSAALNASLEQVLMYIHGQQGLNRHCVSRGVGEDHRPQPLLKVSYSHRFMCFTPALGKH